ncbi:phage tail tape measure protein [Streptomyces halstedii]|uniref:phage tail tape measure protein n=1 Tax=Streptomyces halstedii TaxID=1944 RepID=UPI00335C1579
MASDTSLIFNLIAKDKVSQTLTTVKEKVNTAAAGIGAGLAAGMGAGLMAHLDMEAASDKLAAQLGVGPAKAAELSKVAAGVYRQAWGDSIETVNEAVRGVYQNIGNSSAAKGGIQGLTTKALALAQTFDQEVSASTAAVGQLMRTGLAKNADEAFDIITAGFQAGVNKSDDFLDTITEYSTQFRSMGLSGQMATGLLAQGLKAGARDADTVADAIKEFSIEAVAGGDRVRGGFKSLGLDADKMVAALAKGGPTAAGALDLTLDKLRQMEPGAKRNAVAIELFGTKAEDLGKSLYSLDPSKAVGALGKVGGAADRMAKTVGDNPKAALERFKRAALTELGAVAGGFAKWAIDNQNVSKPLAIGLGVIAGLILTIKVGMLAWTAAQALWTVATTVATGVQWLWNTALAANPIGLIILAVVGLVAGIVLLWKKSDTFKAIVTGAFNAVWGAIKGVFNWTKKNWPLLLAILTGPIGWATLAIVKNWDKIKSGGAAVWRWISSLPGKIKNGFAKVGGWISAPFRAGFNAVSRFWNSTAGRLTFRVPNWVPGIGGAGWAMPRLPYLAKGGNIRSSGFAVVGEAGPEVVHLPGGASVTPLGRGGGGGQVRVVVDATGAEAGMLRLMRHIVRVYGQGDVQVAFGTGQ